MNEGVYWLASRDLIKVLLKWKIIEGNSAKLIDCTQIVDLMVRQTNFDRSNFSSFLRTMNHLLSNKNHDRTILYYFLTKSLLYTNNGFLDVVHGNAENLR